MVVSEASFDLVQTQLGLGCCVSVYEWPDNERHSLMPEHLGLPSPSSHGSPLFTAQGVHARRRRDSTFGPNTGMLHGALPCPWFWIILNAWQINPTSFDDLPDFSNQSDKPYCLAGQGVSIS